MRLCETFNCVDINRKQSEEEKMLTVYCSERKTSDNCVWIKWTIVLNSVENNELI